jgi:hypothetical protein
LAPQEAYGISNYQAHYPGAFSGRFMLWNRFFSGGYQPFGAALRA